MVDTSEDERWVEHFKLTAQLEVKYSNAEVKFNILPFFYLDKVMKKQCCPTGKRLDIVPLPYFVTLYETYFTQNCSKYKPVFEA